MKQNHQVQTKEINYLQEISNEKVIKDSSQVPRNISLKISKTKNSYVYDEISTKILKLRCPFISSPINYICNKMLFWDVCPDRLKYAIITPLHKNDVRSEVSNYRPVSLLTSFSKIFETVMQRTILKHLTNYNILSTEQYGLRLGLRADNATYKLKTEFLML